MLKLAMQLLYVSAALLNRAHEEIIKAEAINAQTAKACDKQVELSERIKGDVQFSLEINRKINASHENHKVYLDNVYGKCLQDCPYKKGEHQ